MDGQRRVVDLIPQRYPVLLLIFLIGVTLIAGLEALYLWMPTLAAHTTDGRVAAFDLDAEGSLGACYSTATLWLAGVLALFVYSVRRHKEDDYQGRYRIWLWAALAWMLMGVDESASLHEGFKEMMVLVSGTRLTGDGSLWWALGYLLVLVPIGVRLLLEMRVCRASTTALLLTAGLYAAAVVVQLQWLLPEMGARGVMVEEGLEMGGNLLLVMAMLLHARYVVLESQGLLTAKPKAAKATKKTAEPAPTRRKRAATDTAMSSSSSRSDLPTATATTARSKTATATQRTDEAEAPTPKQRLSKAERRAMRRQQRAERDEY